MNITALIEQADKLESAGFTGKAAELKAQADRARRQMIAYEKYRYVTADKIQAFQDKLKKDTFRTEGAYPSLYHVYDQLKFSPVEAYSQIPPGDVLEKVAAAKKEGIFDTLEVAKIESTREYKDPIVFGVIQGCPDKFYVAQWDTDVSIDDIIGKHEG